MSIETKVITQQEAERREALAASCRSLPGPARPTCAASFELSQPVLLQALSTVMKTIPTSRYGLDILKHVQIAVEADHAVLRGTNLETGIELTVQASVLHTGMYTVNAKLLHDCVKTFPKAGEVSLSVKDECVVASCGKRSFALKDATDGSDFPCLPDCRAQSCVIQASVLRQAIREVEYAAATDDSRPVFLAIYMHIQERSINLVAIDGLRMAIRSLALPQQAGREASVLIPADTWRLATEVLPKEAEITITWDKDRAAFTCGNLRLVSRLIEGTYPKYTAALPSSHDTTFTLPRADLVSLLRAFKPFTRDSSNILRISYQAGEVTFSASSDDLGEVSDTLETQVQGEASHVFLNAEYVADVLDAVKSDAFTFSASGPRHSVLLSLVGRDDYQALIMPMSCDRKNMSTVETIEEPPLCEMKVTLQQEVLSKGLALVSKSVPSRSRLPILDHVCLEASDCSYITLSTTDLETGISLSLHAEVEHQGTWTIPARLLLDCVKTFPKGQIVTLLVNDGQLVVCCERRKFILDHGTDGKEFPILPETLPNGPCTLLSNDLSQGIKEVQFAAASSLFDDRPTFFTVCLDMHESHLNLVACKSFHLAVRTLPLETGREAQLLVPVPSMQLLSSILPPDVPVAITWDNTQERERVVFQAGQVRFVSRLLRAPFPEHMALIPRNEDTCLILAKSDLVSLLDAFRPFTRDSANILRIFYQRDRVTFKAASEDRGEVCDELIANVSGPEGEVILNAKCVLDFLKAVSAQNIAFSLCGHDRLVVLRAAGRDDLLYVLHSMGPAR